MVRLVVLKNSVIPNVIQELVSRKYESCQNSSILSNYMLLTLSCLRLVNHGARALSKVQFDEPLVTEEVLLGAIEAERVQ